MLDRYTALSRGSRTAARFSAPLGRMGVQTAERAVFVIGHLRTAATVASLWLCASCVRLGYLDRPSDAAPAEVDGRPDAGLLDSRPLDGPNACPRASCDSDGPWVGSDLGPAVQLSWNTFLGGTGIEYGKALALDGEGNIYVGGWSQVAWGDPVSPFNDGNWDAFVAKLDANGDLVWHTFLGGRDWAGDGCFGLVLDPGGRIYLTGYSERDWGAPVRAYAGGTKDAFVAKLDRDGRLLWHTFLGGAGEDTGKAIALAAGGDIIIGGTSSAAWSAPSTQRPYAGARDAFVARLDPNGTLLWNAFLGSTTGDDEYSGTLIALDAQDRIYAAGFSTRDWGGPLRAFSGSSDGFVARLEPSGALTWSTFLGGAGGDEARAIARHPGGDLFVAGLSDSAWGTPVSPFSGGNYDAFAARLDASGRILWSSFLGGTDTDVADSIAIDAAGEVYIAGHSRSGWGQPLHPFAGGPSDALVAKLDGLGVLRWHTFLGGQGPDRVDDDYAQAIVLDGVGNILVAGDSQENWGSPRRPRVPNSHDAFAARLARTP